MNGLSIIMDGVSYDVPGEIEAKGDQAVAAWLQSASAQQARQGDAEKPAKPARAPKTPTVEG